MATRLIYAVLPQPYRRSGQQLSADGETKLHCDVFCIEQMQAYADATYELRKSQESRDGQGRIREVGAEPA